MKKRMMLILCLGVSFAPPAFALGEIPKASMFDKRSIRCAGVRSDADKKSDESTASEPTHGHDRTRADDART